VRRGPTQAVLDQSGHLSLGAVVQRPVHPTGAPSVHGHTSRAGLGPMRDGSGQMVCLGILSVARRVSLYGCPVAPPCEPDDVLPVEAEQRLSKPSDPDADRRDQRAEVRDRSAEVRDRSAEVRDHMMSGEADPKGGRRKAAQDRLAAAVDRDASSDDRRYAREASQWNGAVARQREADLLQALNDSDDPGALTLLIGQAQSVLMQVLDVDPRDALIELGDRASRDQLGLQEAARRVIAESHESLAAPDATS